MRISDWSSDVCSSDLAPPLGAAIAICLLINPRHPLRQRILDACRIAVVSGSIFVLWTFASEALVGRSTGRPLQFYGNMDSDAWMSSLAALMAWLLPEQIPISARITVFSLALRGEIGRASRRDRVCQYGSI